MLRRRSDLCPAIGFWAVRLGSYRGGAIRCRGFTRGVAQLGSVLRSGRRGRGFESRHPDSRNPLSPGRTGGAGFLPLLAGNAGKRRASHSRPCPRLRPGRHGSQPAVLQRFRIRAYVLVVAPIHGLKGRLLHGSGFIASEPASWTTQKSGWTSTGYPRRVRRFTSAATGTTHRHRDSCCCSFLPRPAGHAAGNAATGGGA